MNKLTKFIFLGSIMLSPSAAFSSGVDVAEEVIIRSQITNPCTGQQVNLKTTLHTTLLGNEGDKLRLKVLGMHETGDGYQGIIHKKGFKIKDNNSDDSSSSSSSEDNHKYSKVIKFKSKVKHDFNKREFEVKTSVTASIVDNELVLTQNVTKLKCKKNPDVSGLISETTVTVVGPERGGVDDFGIQSALDAFDAYDHLTVNYIGSDQVGFIISQAIASGSAPNVPGTNIPVDIIILPQPGLLDGLVESGAAKVVSKSTEAAVSANWKNSFENYVTLEDTLYGTPTKTDIKSIVYYRPNEFSNKGYTVPQTWEELVSLSEQMVDNGDTPWCVGLESGAATGWNFTDWVEVLLLGSEPVEVYDDWVANDIGFTDSRIRQAFEDVLSLWSTPGVVLGDPMNIGESIINKNFFDSLFEFVFGGCLMHRQANFSTFAFGPNDDPSDPGYVDVFVFPPKANKELALMGAGVFAVGLTESDAVQEVVGYMSTPDYAQARVLAQGGGFMTAVIGLDSNIYPTLIENKISSILTNPLYKEFRFDASDLMPPEIGASFLADIPSISMNVDFTMSPYAPFDGTGYFASADPGNGILYAFDIASGFWGQGSAVVVGDGNTASLGTGFLFNNFEPPEDFDPSNCGFPADPNNPLCPAPVPLEVYAINPVQGVSVCQATLNIETRFCEVVPDGAACDTTPAPGSCD